MKKKRKVLACLLIIILVTQISIRNVSDAKTVADTKTVDKTAIQTADGLNGGDLLPIAITEVTKEQIKEVPTYNQNIKKRNLTFATTKTSYSSTYGYDLLANDTYKGVYQDLVAACEAFTKSDNDATLVSDNIYGALTVTVEENTLRTSELDAILCSLYYDHPEFYWLDSFAYTYNTSNYIVSITAFCSNEYRLGTTRTALNTKMDTEIKRYLNLVNGVSSDYKKELIIHDEIINQVQYAFDNNGNPSVEKWAHSIVGVFDTSYNRVVCEGYAKAFQLLMNACGIECIYVPGTANGSGHGWNKVKLDGDWYNVDVTWDDPTSGNGTPILSHDYFNVTDAKLLTNHTPGNTMSTGINSWCYSLPVSNAIIYKYVNSDSSQKYTIKYNQTANATVTLYNQGAVVATDSAVASGSAITVEAVPKDQDNTYIATYSINNQSAITMNEKIDQTSGKISYSNTFVMPESDVNVAVTLTQVVKKYSVTFNSKGGSAVQKITDIVEGSTITLPTEPKYKGYVFGGWYEDEEYKVVFNESSVVNKDMTLYAKWIASELVKIEANYSGINLIVGTGINKSDIDVFAVYDDGNRELLSASKFSIYPETIDNTGNNTIEVSYSGKTANVIIYGVEESRLCTVSFDSQGGSSVSPIKNVKHGDKITLPTNPTMNGYFFGGWYTQKACLTKFISDSEITSDITLYAKWVSLLSDPKNTIKNISATYTGNSILVGNSISKSDVKVTVTDMNGVKHSVTDFTIPNYKITVVGNNTLTATFGGFSTNFTVKGISTQSGGNDNYKYVTFISAGYYGGPVEVGSSVDPNNITVIAAYNDNSVAYITDFSLSNTVITSLGTNTIYIYYSGYTATVNVTGIAKGSSTPTTPVQPPTSTTVIAASSSISTSVIKGGYQGIVFPRISLTTNPTYSTITAEIEEKVLASAIAGKDLGNTNILQLTLNSIGSQVLTQLYRANVNEVYVKVCMPIQYYGRNDIQISNIAFDNATLTRIKDSSKSVYIQYVGSSYSTETGKTYYTNPICTLTLKGKEFHSTANTNVALRVTSLEKDYQIESAVNQYLKAEDRGNGIVVTLGQNGELNNFGTVTVDVGGSLGKESGDKVYVYGYNASTKKLEELPITKYTVDKNQNISLAVCTYSKYVILKEETDQKVTTIASRSKVSKSLTMKKDNNKQLIITLTPDISKDDVKITYKSSNSKVAYVSKVGKVYGKKKGNAVITTTITYGKNSKKFTTKIVVK